MVEDRCHDHWSRTISNGRSPGSRSWNPNLSGVINVTDFTTTAAGQRILDDARLAGLVQVLNKPEYHLDLEAAYA